ncbi:hypothetical protein E2C01_094181 [Portunus trituberculatus]|uniref:Uncharacterized protein n=1 Tax=Portunus trituberculatus TaxID=210409 RepID=A0A5B7JVH4_PORTR|nr:hypothetical protein [Portunus trituberculatus]
MRGKTVGPVPVRYLTNPARLFCASSSSDPFWLSPGPARLTEADKNICINYTPNENTRLRY